MKWLVGLNSIRIYAIILIVVYHFFRAFLPGGFIAVELFFGISSFLITTKLIREYMGRQKIQYFKFLRERLARLWPPLALMILAVLASSLLINTDVLSGLRLRTLTAATFSTNILELASGGSYENAISPNLFEHTWFLGLEMQFLIILPLIISVFLGMFKKRRSGLKYLAVLFLGLGLVSTALQFFYASIEQYDRAYFALDTHFAAFAFSACFAILNYLIPRTPRTHKIIPCIGLIMSLAIITMLAFKVNYSSLVAFAFALPFTALLTPIIIFCIIKLQANQGTKKATSKLVRLGDYLGSYSFGIYLFHYPAFLVLSYVMPAGMPSWGYALIAIGISIVLTILSTRFFKKIYKLNEYRRAHVRRGRWLLPLTPIALILAVFVGLGAYRLVTATNDSNISAQLASQKTEAIKLPEENSEYISGDDITILAKDYLKPTLEVARTLAPARIEVRPSNKTIDGATILMIGDSVMLGAKDNIEQTIPGAYVDAKESRGIETAVGIINSYKAQGKLPKTIVISLITNERYISSATFDAIINAAGSDHKFILMTGYAGPTQPRDSQNAVVRNYANSHNNVELVDWYSIAVNNWSLMYADHIHLNAEGRSVYTKMLANKIGANL